MLSRRQFTCIFTAVSLGGPIIGNAFAQSVSGAALDRVRSSGMLRVGMVADAAPFYTKDFSTGEWAGIYTDLYRALARELGVQLSVVETTWGNSVLDLQSNKLDLFIGLNPTPERQAVIDFSVPVVKSAFALLVRQGFERKTWADFNSPDVRVAVDIGSSQDACVSRNLPNATITRLRSTSDATTALQAGRADVQCLTLVLAMRTRKVNPSLGTVIVPEPVAATSSHAGFRRQADSSLREYVDNWINKHRESGYVRKTVVENLRLVGLSEDDIPQGTSLF